MWMPAPRRSKRCCRLSKRATEMLATHRGALLALVDELMAQGQVTPARLAEVVGLPLGAPEDALDPYAQSLAVFREGRLELLKA